MVLCLISYRNAHLNIRPVYIFSLFTDFLSQNLEWQEHSHYTEKTGITHHSCSNNPQTTVSLTIIIPTTSQSTIISRIVTIIPFFICLVRLGGNDSPANYLVKSGVTLGSSRNTHHASSQLPSTSVTSVTNKSQLQSMSAVLYDPPQRTLIKNNSRAQIEKRQSISIDPHLHHNPY